MGKSNLVQYRDEASQLSQSVYLIKGAIWCAVNSKNKSLIPYPNKLILCPDTSLYLASFPVLIPQLLSLAVQIALFVLQVTVAVE